MISFDVVSLFTNVPLEKTIDIIMKKVYKEKLVKTKIKEEQLRQLLLLCTKEGHFTFNNETYIQTDGVMMGSPLGSLIANIYMCELETNLIPTFGQTVQFWTRYVDDTFAFIKPASIQYVLQRLNSYDERIQFTYEVEKDRKIAFLDVLIEINTRNELETSVYRKSTNNNIYINWNAYSPRSWKIGTLRNLLRRAITVCSTKDKLQAEIKHLQDAFCDINEYPQKLVKSITNDELAKHQQQETENELRGNTDTNDTNENTNEDEPRTVQLSLPYAGNHGEILTKKLKRSIEAKSKKLKIRITYTPSKLGSRFQIKDKTKLEHQHNVSYHVDCGNQRCPSNYVGQTKRRMGVRTDNHHGTDKKSHVLAHSKKTRHRRVTLKNVRILGSGYRNTFKRRISEALFIKELKPDLNVQEEAFKLSLYN